MNTDTWPTHARERVRAVAGSPEEGTAFQSIQIVSKSVKNFCFVVQGVALVRAQHSLEQQVCDDFLLLFTCSRHRTNYSFETWRRSGGGGG